MSDNGRNSVREYLCTVLTIIFGAPTRRVDFLKATYAPARYVVHFLPDGWYRAISPVDVIQRTC